MYLAHQAKLAASGVMIGMDPGVALTLLDQALNLQVTYGAVMLSFLGSSNRSDQRRIRLNYQQVLFIGAWKWPATEAIKATLVSHLELRPC